MNLVSRVGKGGSIDIWFRPKLPHDVADECSYRRCRHVLVALRLYGTGVEFYDQTWMPDDVVSVK